MSVTFDTWATASAATANSSNVITGATAGTTGSAGYYASSWLIADQSTVLTTFTGANAAKKTDAENYTDGYALFFSATFDANDIYPADNTAAAASTTPQTMMVCMAGTVAAGTGSSTQTAQAAASCWESSVLSADNTVSGSTDITVTDADVYTAAFDVTNIDVSNATNYPSVAASSIAAGFNKTWVVTNPIADLTAQTDLQLTALLAGGDQVFTGTRFLPKWAKDAYAASDLRFDPTVSGQQGMSEFAATTTMTWSAAATLKGAAQLASAATAAAIVALTF